MNIGPIRINSFCGYYTRFDAYPNYIQIKMFVKTTYNCIQRGKKERKEKKPHRLGLMLGLAYSMPDC
jgi:hypothetical protein